MFFFKNREKTQLSTSKRLSTGASRLLRRRRARTSPASRRAPRRQRSRCVGEQTHCGWLATRRGRRAAVLAASRPLCSSRLEHSRGEHQHGFAHRSTSARPWGRVGSAAQARRSAEIGRRADVRRQTEIGRRSAIRRESEIGRRAEVGRQAKWREKRGNERSVERRLVTDKAPSRPIISWQSLSLCVRT